MFTIKTYKERIEEVKRVVPADKLLVFEVADGWEPLCKFLGVDVPDVPFPAINKRKEMINKLAVMEEVGFTNVPSDILNA